MRFKRKLERKQIKAKWERYNRSLQKRYRGFYNDLWKEHQDKKYGEDYHKIIVKLCSKRKGELNEQ